MPAGRACLLAGLLMTAAAAPTPVVAQGATKELAWKDLLPPAAKAAKPYWLPRRRAADDDSLPQPHGGAEERWLSRRTERTAINTEIVPALDGVRVRLGGYVVPLELDATRVSEFLLVPFVGACIHVPPPPPNQIVLVKAAAPVTVRTLFDPVYVTGVIKVVQTTTELADVGYSIHAAEVRHDARPRLEADED